MSISRHPGARVRDDGNYCTQEEVAAYVSKVQEEMQMTFNKELAEAKKNVVNQVRAELDNVKRALETNFNDQVPILNKALEDDKERMSKKGKENLTQKRSFDKVPKYSGKHLEYEDWKFQMTTFLNESPQMKEALSLINEFVKQPTNEEIEVMFNKVEEKLGEENVDREWVNHQLYQVLSLNLTSNGLGTIKNMMQEKEVNGVLGW